MICPGCRAENGPGTRFCGQCGTALPVSCPACGAANPADNRFCGQCASPLRPVPAGGDSGAIADRQQSSPSGEFRQVTVLFCDIVNSTGLAERLGDETLHELLRRFLDAGIAEVRRFDGTVPQFTGDGFMALFGAPVAHEDHVRRALLAAMAILRIVEHTADGEVADLAIRIGINSGLVVFGAVADSLNMDFTAIGDTANVAARLQTEAEPNSIVISETTLALAGGYARAEPIGALQLKGKQEPISAFRLVDVSSRPHTAGASPFGSRLFVGREHELALLDDLLGRANAGNGQAVGVQGEPGIGKSRLVAELSRRSSGHCTWIEGHCVSYGSAIPYMLALDLFRSGCGILDKDQPAEIAGKVRAGLRMVGMDPESDSPLLLRLLGIVDAAEARDQDNLQAVKARAFAILRQFAINLSQRQLLVLVIEDLHWVDSVSEEFLDLMVESLSGARILVLATYRPGYRPRWIGKSYAAQIALQPLTRDDSRQMLRSVLDDTRLLDILAGTILARAEGNPFFLEQLALHVGEEPAVHAAQTVPATIRDVVMARIDRLPPATRRLLQVASVAGREFPLGLIRGVWRGRETLASLLDELLHAEFLFERADSDETSYVFRHALTQDAAYTGLLARDRRRTHAEVGRALEALYPDRTDEVAELLALHYGRSDVADKAVDYAILAAEKAQQRWANAEALSYFEAALRRLGTMPDSEPNRLRRIDSIVKQVEVMLALGRHAEHMAALAGIRDIVASNPDPRRRASWHYWMGFLSSLTGGHPTTAIEHCREAARIAALTGFDELDGHIQSCLSQAYIVAGELRAAIDSGERALSIFTARRNRWYSSRALWHLSTAANYLGEWQTSLDYCRRAFEHGVALDDIRLKGVALWRTGSVHIQRGDIAEGLGCCEEALALNPNPYDSATARLIRGYGLIKAGEAESGIAELSEVAAWFESSGLAYIRSLAMLWLAEGYLTANDTAQAARLVGEVIAICRDTGYVHYQALAQMQLGRCLASQEPMQAERHLDESLRFLEHAGARNDAARALVIKAELRRAGGDEAGAAGLLERAASIFRELGTRGAIFGIDAAMPDDAAPPPLPRRVSARPGAVATR